jgi:alpha-tubulin suppressor-like RCC1 family protein
MPNQFLSPEGDLENYFVTEYWLIDQWVGDTLWTWGNSGNQGRLGDNTNFTIICTPITTFAGGNNWKQSSSGNSGGATAAIKTDGTLWIWGNISNGQLGNNNATIAICTPVTTFAGGTNWKQVSCGNGHVAAIKTDGTLWTWGSNSSGELGTNNTIDRSTPVTTFAGGTDWKQVSCGANHIAAIKTDGSLWTWGRGNFVSGIGGLGTNSAANISTPVTTFAGGNNWKQVSSGEFITAAIKTDGTLWVWGRNDYFGFTGSLGTNSATNISTPVTTFAGGNNWKQVSANALSMAAIKTDGTLWTWGWNRFGYIGDNTIIPRCTPVTTFAGGTNWKQVSVGMEYMSAVKTDGTLWSWGYNSSGNSGSLGNNRTINSSTPVTTFAGGTNWKQVACGLNCTAVTSGTDPTFFIA